MISQLSSACFAVGGWMGFFAGLGYLCAYPESSWEVYATALAFVPVVSACALSTGFGAVFMMMNLAAEVFTMMFNKTVLLTFGSMVSLITVAILSFWISAFYNTTQRTIKQEVYVPSSASSVVDDADAYTQPSSADMSVSTEASEASDTDTSMISEIEKEVEIEDAPLKCDACPKRETCDMLCESIAEMTSI